MEAERKEKIISSNYLTAMLSSDFNRQILIKIRDQLRKQIDLGYNVKETAIMLRAFEIAIRENGAMDIMSQKEQDMYNLGVTLFLSKHLTII
jgi:hypothetical protein